MKKKNRDVSQGLTSKSLNELKEYLTENARGCSCCKNRLQGHIKYFFNKKYGDGCKVVHVSPSYLLKNCECYSIIYGGEYYDGCLIHDKSSIYHEVDAGLRSELGVFLPYERPMGVLVGVMT